MRSNVGTLKGRSRNLHFMTFAFAYVFTRVYLQWSKIDVVVPGLILESRLRCCRSKPTSPYI
ncbi:hypothetical protein BR93DRAFT_922999 [Coniochaeta sp. PMI_546]|nr:hypothetical protein BR93DRAFT_922999 [Coniochaeta sp. PMI_546]